MAGRSARAPAKNTANSHGTVMVANRAICRKPRIARTVNTAPIPNVTTTHPTLLGYTSVRAGLGTLKASPTADAETEIMAPARMQYISALATL